MFVAEVHCQEKTMARLWFSGNIRIPGRSKNSCAIGEILATGEPEFGEICHLKAPTLLQDTGSPEPSSFLNRFSAKAENLPVIGQRLPFRLSALRSSECLISQD
jgi:hypothetical protein